jgi:hypothetical protein
MSELASMITGTGERILSQLPPTGGARDVTAAFAAAGLDRPFTADPELTWRDLAGVVLAMGAAGADAAAADAMAADELARRVGLPIAGQVILGSGTLIAFEPDTPKGSLETAGDLAPTCHVLADVTEVVLGDGEPSFQVVNLPVATADRRTTTPTVAGAPRTMLRFEGVRPIASGPLQRSAPCLHAGARMRALLIAGACARATELTLAYTQERRQFGKPLASFQAIQHSLARLAEESLAARAIALRAAYATGTADAALLTAAARVRTAEAAKVVYDLAHQCHGAIGFTADYPLQEVTRRLLVWRTEFGTPRDWSRELARRIRENSGDLWGLATGTPVSQPTQVS